MWQLKKQCNVTLRVLAQKLNNFLVKLHKKIEIIKLREKIHETGEIDEPTKRVTISNNITNFDEKIYVVYIISVNFIKTTIAS